MLIVLVLSACSRVSVDSGEQFRIVVARPDLEQSTSRDAGFVDLIPGENASILAKEDFFALTKAGEMLPDGGTVWYVIWVHPDSTRNPEIVLSPGTNSTRGERLVRFIESRMKTLDN